MSQQFQYNLTPGQVETHMERYHLPSGRYRELRRTLVTVQDADGLFHTEETVEVIPPLDCSCIVKDLHDVFECAECQAIVCSNHSATCPECGNVYCAACLKTVTIDGRELRLCEKCAKKLTTHPLIKFLKKIWEMS
jgi:hypothetical protein